MILNVRTRSLQSSLHYSSWRMYLFSAGLLWPSNSHFVPFIVSENSFMIICLHLFSNIYALLWHKKWSPPFSKKRILSYIQGMFCTVSLRFFRPRCRMAVDVVANSEDPTYDSTWIFYVFWTVYILFYMISKICMIRVFMTVSLVLYTIKFCYLNNFVQSNRM